MTNFTTTEICKLSALCCARGKEAQEIMESSTASAAEKELAQMERDYMARLVSKFTAVLCNNSKRISVGFRY